MKIVDLRKEKIKNAGYWALGLFAIGLEIYAGYLFTTLR